MFKVSADNLATDPNIICVNQRKSSGSSSVSSNNSGSGSGNNNTSNSTYQAQFNQRRSSGELKNYMVIQSFEPKPRKRL